MSQSADTEGTNGQAPSNELDRVRELILGPDSRSRLQRAEADRLRDILLGPQLEDIQRTFSDLRSSNERMQRDLQALTDRVALHEQTVNRRLDALEQDSRRFRDDLRRLSDIQRARDDQMQQVVAQLHQHDLARQGLARHVTDLRALHEANSSDLRALSNSVSEHRESYDRQLQGVRREVRQTDDSIRSELRRIADRLENQKTDRRALAAMLIEVATRLETGETMTGVVESFNQPS